MNSSSQRGHDNNAEGLFSWHHINILLTHYVMINRLESIHFRAYIRNENELLRAKIARKLNCWAPKYQSTLR
jgi:hypothetical protein